MGVDFLDQLRSGIRNRLAYLAGPSVSGRSGDLRFSRSCTLSSGSPPFPPCEAVPPDLLRHRLARSFGGGGEEVLGSGGRASC